MSDPLELELYVVMSSPVGAGIEPGSPGKAASALNCPAITPNCRCLFLALPDPKTPQWGAGEAAESQPSLGMSA